MESFWQRLRKPFFVLAPMEDVTDAAFRQLIARFGKPDVTFTEFTSADGLIRANESGQKKLRKKLLFSEIERPIVAQLFSAKPDYMREAAMLVKELGFDGIDINMGCPVDEVVRQQCGAAMMKDPENARAVIRAAKESGLPTSVKTRIGFNSDELETWLPVLLSEDLEAITIHGRTRKEMSDVPAHWDRIKRAVEIRDEIAPKTRIIGNGDVVDLTDAKVKATESGCDGIMLGRAIFGNPWLFTGRNDITKEERLDGLLEHIAIFDELLTGTTNFAVLKKHFKAYVSGWDGAKELRIKLMETENVDQAKNVLREAR